MDHVRSQDWEHLDGVPMFPGERARCDSCSRNLRPENWRIQYIQERED